MEGLSQSQTNHVRHLKAFVAAQVDQNTKTCVRYSSYFILKLIISISNSSYSRYLCMCWCVSGGILCTGSPRHAGPQQRAQQVGSNNNVVDNISENIDIYIYIVISTCLFSLPQRHPGGLGPGAANPDGPGAQLHGGQRARGRPGHSL